jgi:hypothetical protein
VDPQRLRELLAAVAAGQVAAEAAAVELAVAMGGGVDDATLDRARAARTGVPEVVLGEWKTAEQIARSCAAWPPPARARWRPGSAPRRPSTCCRRGRRRDATTRSRG